MEPDDALQPILSPYQANGWRIRLKQVASSPEDKINLRVTSPAGGIYTRNFVVNGNLAREVEKYLQALPARR